VAASTAVPQEPDGRRRRGPMPRRSERWLVALARRVLAVFFRRIEVEGLERVPHHGPLLVVANHVNGLLDPMLVVGTLPRLPRFLGKSGLWDIAPLRPFLAWARVIPVHRPGDPGADPEQNAAAFAAAAEVLAAGGAVSIFPEGRSHNEPGLAPLKTGAARIALAAAAARPGLGLDVLPVGLVFDAKERFRSRALVEIGEPLRVNAPDDPADPREVRALTERIDAALDRVTVSYATWDEARLIGRAAEICSSWRRCRAASPPPSWRVRSRVCSSPRRWRRSARC
jgi:glycerol-3-phosphate O-acyltransferase / dihydroxyacetone phosphate acyltransferase